MYTFIPSLCLSDHSAQQRHKAATACLQCGLPQQTTNPVVANHKIKMWEVFVVCVFFLTVCVALLDLSAPLFPGSSRQSQQQDAGLESGGHQEREEREEKALCPLLCPGGKRSWGRGTLNSKSPCAFFQILDFSAHLSSGLHV